MRKNIFKVLLGTLVVLVIIGINTCERMPPPCGQPTEEEKEGWTIYYYSFATPSCFYGIYNNLWISGKLSNGIMHFDGDTFKGYTPDEIGMSGSIHWLEIKKIGGFKGKVYFDIVHQGLLEYDNGVWNLYPEKEGVFTATDSVLWIWSRGKRFLYMFDGSVFDSIIDSTITDTFTCMETDKDGRIWLGSDEGLVYYDGSFHRLTSSPGNLKCNRILKDRNNALWFTMDDSVLYKLNADNLTFTKPYDDPELARGLRAFDLDNNFWVILDNGGVGKFDGKNWTRYYGIYRWSIGDDTNCDDRCNSGLASSKIYGIYVDDLNNKWFGNDYHLSVYSK